MDFGFTLKPDHDIERFVALTRQAEAAGFTYGWLFDNHVPFREVYPLLTLMALNEHRSRDEFGAASAAFVAEDVVDRLAIVGPPEEHVRRLTELSEAGVDQFNLYLMSGDEEAQLDAYGSTVIPAVRLAGPRTPPSAALPGSQSK